MKEKIKETYERLAHNYNALIDHKPHNAHYDRPNTLNLMGDCQGKHVLDAACGPGKYAEELISRGAKVTGIDLSAKMIACAKTRNKNKGTFFVHDLEEPFKMFENSSFDMVVCALALHYIQDWNPTIREFYRVLKADGDLIISIEHPFFQYTYFKSKKYFDIEPVKCTWNGFGHPVEMHSYRRSLNDCLMPLFNNGFCVTQLIEPKPTESFKKVDPKHYKALNAFPAFLCIGARKKSRYQASMASD